MKSPSPHTRLSVKRASPFLGPFCFKSNSVFKENEHVIENVCHVERCYRRYTHRVKFLLTVKV